ncbi:hypothetical protein LJC03_00345 [Methanobrevibacter sp. OttesenSCG-928-I08]|nr:hypothetical protein [Methanobrevibacter sp. OttesenSCG-928-I08]
MNRDKINEKIAEYFNSYTHKNIEKIKISEKNFYYLYETKTITINETIANIDINPVCLIVETTEKEYYLYSLNEEYNNYIIKNKENILNYFVKKFLIND